MTRQLIPILSIVIGSAFLMLAGGMHGLILPLRGSLEGFSTLNLGLLGTAWALGFIGGCIYTPRLVRRVGHVRTFSVMAALSVVSVLLTIILINPVIWIILRSLTGFCFAAGSMIVESWLNERTEDVYRGRVFGVYTMANLGAITLGQMLIVTGDSSGFTFFILSAVFYALSLVPTAISTAAAPKPLVESGLDLKALFKNSPIALVAAFLIGASNSAFGSLGVVFGESIDLNVTTIALMMSTSILAGAILQIPVGYISDKMDRRMILIGLMIIAAIVDMTFIISTPKSPLAVLLGISIFGAMIYSAYPVIIAHASDHADASSFIKISGGLLLMYGLGAIIGPLIAGTLMSVLPFKGLFISTFCAHMIIIIYGIWRLNQRTSLTEEDKSDFVGIAPGRFATPETSALDPRSVEPELNDWSDRIETEDES